MPHSLVPIPTGIVTLVFTDIQGSVDFFEKFQDDFKIVLEAHHRLMRAVTAAWQGIEISTIGDAFFLAFDNPANAVSFSVAAQQALRREDWSALLPGVTEVRVRIGMHTGEARCLTHPNGSLDYFGSTPNRAARVSSAAHGGQILISEATYTLASESLDPDITFRDCGLHRLKGLGEERIYQVLHSDLPSEFPPIRSLSNPALLHNLPLQVTSFVSREREIEEVKALLQQTRILSLTGFGGCGKTRLALQVGADLLESYAQGVWLIELAPITTPDLLAQSIAQTLGMPEAPGKPVLQSLEEHLREKRLLLLLDNCEHLLDACAHLADRLIRTCPQLTLLTTSREKLGIPGEIAYQVPPLSLPDAKQSLTSEALLQSGAVRLFLDRALSAKPDFAFTESSIKAISQLCQRLDGIPLALELAAARVTVLSPEQIMQRLDDRFRLLTTGSRTALPRQKTLRATVDWSYELLEENERILLRRLSVFTGGWSLEGVEAVCTGGSIEDWEVLDLLAHLVDKSLVVAEEKEAGERRYRLLETIRQYAAERLKEAEEGEELRQRHAEWYIALAERLEPQLTGSAQVAALQRLEMEHANLRTALDWLEAEAGRPVDALRLAGALSRFWLMRGYLIEGRERLEKLLSRHAQEIFTAPIARALNGAGILCWSQGDFGAAQGYYERSLIAWREVGDLSGEASSLSNLGLVFADMGRFSEVRPLYEASLEIRRTLGDRWAIANTLNNLGSLELNQGKVREALPFYEECLAMRRQLADKDGLANTLSNLGWAYWHLEDYRQARRLLTESLTLFQELNNSSGIIYATHNIADVAFKEHSWEEARDLYAFALTKCLEIGDRWGLCLSYIRLGDVELKIQTATSAMESYRNALDIALELVDNRLLIECLQGITVALFQTNHVELAAHITGFTEAVQRLEQKTYEAFDPQNYHDVLQQIVEVLGSETYASAIQTGNAWTAAYLVSALRPDRTENKTLLGVSR